MKVSLPTAEPAVLVTAVGAAEGSRAAAAALACAGADVDRATLFVDVGGRAPRPTLLASAAAQRLEERLVAHLPAARAAARGHVCHLAVDDDPDGLEIALAATAVARDELRVIHVLPSATQALLGSRLGEELSGVLLRADVSADRPLLALAAAGFLSRGLGVAVLKRQLPWIVERRALFGALPPDAASGLPKSILRKLLSEACYGGSCDQRADATTP